MQNFNQFPQFGPQLPIPELPLDPNQKPEHK